MSRLRVRVLPWAQHILLREKVKEVKMKYLQAWGTINFILLLISLCGLIMTTFPNLTNIIMANVWLGGMIFSFLNLIIVGGIFIVSEGE